MLAEPAAMLEFSLFLDNLHYFELQGLSFSWTEPSFLIDVPTNRNLPLPRTMQNTVEAGHNRRVACWVTDHAVKL